MVGRKKLEYILSKYEKEVAEYTNKLRNRARVQQAIVELILAYPEESITVTQERLMEQGYDKKLVEYCSKELVYTQAKNVELIESSKKIADDIYRLINEELESEGYKALREMLYGKKLLMIQYKLVGQYLKEKLNQISAIQHTRKISKMTALTQKYLIKELVDELGTKPEKKSDISYKDLRASLKIAQEELERYKVNEKISKEEQVIKDVVNFLSTLNEEENGSLLDELSRCSELVMKYSSGQVISEKEFSSVMVLIKSLMRFFDEFGITKIEERKEFMSTQEQLGRCKYRGEGFKSAEDKKIIEVASPGWQYKEHIISQPVYIGKAGE